MYPPPSVDTAIIGMVLERISNRFVFMYGKNYSSDLDCIDRQRLAACFWCAMATNVSQAVAIYCLILFYKVFFNPTILTIFGMKGKCDGVEGWGKA